MNFQPGIEVLGAALHSSPVIFLGAGACWDSGLPMGDEAATLIVRSAFHHAGLEKLCCEMESDPNFKGWSRFEVVLDCFSRYIADFPVRIARTFSKSGLASTHRFLVAHLPGATLWLTTNFDYQIERSLEEAHREYRSISSCRMLESGTKRSQDTVVKLHGDSNSLHPETGNSARLRGRKSGSSSRSARRKLSTVPAVSRHTGRSRSPGDRRRLSALFLPRWTVGRVLHGDRRTQEDLAGWR